MIRAKTARCAPMSAPIPFRAKREHFIQLRPGERRFFTGALYFNEFAVFGSHKIEINGNELCPPRN